MVSWKLVACASALSLLFLIVFSWNSVIGRMYDNSPLHQILSNDTPISFDPKINKVKLEDLDLETLKFLLHGMLSRTEKICNHTRLFGQTSKDGGYDICLDGPLRPIPDRCTVFSFGIANDWSFDEGIANYGCMVNAFDPSLGVGDHLHKKNVQFYNTGLGKSNEVNAKGWKMKNIMTILEDLGKTDQIIDVIKCDAEGAEWPFLEDLAMNRIGVKQVILEIHSPKRHKKKVTKEDVIGMIGIFHRLMERGYIVWRSKIIYSCCLVFSPMMPPGVTERCCYEIYLYNKRYL